MKTLLIVFEMQTYRKDMEYLCLLKESKILNRDSSLVYLSFLPSVHWMIHSFMPTVS